jgi:hypothetical protein
MRNQRTTTKIEARDEKPDDAWRGNRDQELRPVAPGGEESHEGKLALLAGDNE